MDHRSPSFEASLLYKTAPTPTVDSIMDDFRAAIEVNGETLQRVEQSDDSFTILSCETVQILLAISHSPLPVRHYLNIDRPAAAEMSENQILGRLTGVQATTTVVVVDREIDTDAIRSSPPPTSRLKRNLCWDITDCLFQQGPTELVFWSADDILYADEEFERACSYAAQQAEQSENKALASATHPIFDHDPVVDDAALAGIISKSERKLLQTPLTETPEEQESSNILSFSLAKGLTDAIDRIQKTVILRRTQNRAAMACTAATVAVTSMPNLAHLML